MPKVVLYHTDGCHLCEQAATLLASIGQPFRWVDIVNSPELVEGYGVRIPVVQRSDGAELSWPFELAELERFLEDS